MEKIFKVGADRFIKAMKEISPEAYEANREYLFRDRMPEDDSLSFRLLKIIYLYVIDTRSKRDWKTVTLLYYLYEIASSGEILFMKTKNNLDEIEMVKRVLRDNRQSVINQAVLAGLVLEYHFRVFFAGSHSKAYSKAITAQLNLLMMTDTSMVDKVKAGVDEEKPLPVRIKGYLDSKMTGQDDAKKVMAMSLYRFIQYGERSVIMLEGSTGVGKTFLFDNLASCEFLSSELTFFSYTATQLTPNGYSGDNVENMLGGFKRACRSRYLTNSNVTRGADKGVIFIDEIDKLFLPNTDGNGEDVNQTVLSQLLTVMAGTATIADVNTRNILFVLAGAFENIENNCEARKRKTKVGFSSQQKTAELDSNEYNLRKELIQAGAPRQFIGRISHFVHMDKIDRNTMKHILINPENGLLTKRAEMLWRDGLVLKVESDEVIECILDEIMERKSGVRGVEEMLKNIIGVYDYNMIEQGYRIMVIGKDVICGAPPRLEKEEVRVESIVRHSKRGRS